MASADTARSAAKDITRRPDQAERIIKNALDCYTAEYQRKVTALQAEIYELRGRRPQ